MTAAPPVGTASPDGHDAARGPPHGPGAGGGTGAAPEAVLADTDALLVTHAPGDPARHVVSFTGIGTGAAAIPVAEWRGTLAGFDASVTTVTDKRRSWYNGTREAVVAALVPVVPPGAVTLGNSMGGFGAFYFASAIPGLRRALAFSPRYSVHPDHAPPRELRRKAPRDGIREHRIAHLLERPSATVEYVAFFGANPLELAHARHLLAVATPRTQVHVVRGTDHKLAFHLRERGVLRTLVDLLLSPGPLDPAAVTALLRRHGVGSHVMTAGAPGPGPGPSGAGRPATALPR